MSYFQNRQVVLKPENALKRVNDLIASGGLHNDKEKRLGLDQLHSVIGGVKRKGVWNKMYEALMKRHIELCVDLKDHHIAKDGLHQYRNLCQAVDPNSFETVIVYLMDLSEARATAARAKADRVSLAAAAKVRDLDQEESPESIMLSSMTEEGSRQRTDREVVVPWLKFLWENYRAILDLLYKIPKLEKVYHKTCEKAFNFCKEYTRVLEFRRLCDMLRTQLNNLQRVPIQTPNRAARAQWEWTPEAIEFHLNTRFAQLEVATSLELWNEGYRTVEDIYAIIVAGKKHPKPRQMMTYYEKLTRIFWVSENKLFHAYAWYRYYNLTCESKKELKAEEKKIMANCVLLSALIVPYFKDIYSSIALDDQEEVVVDKNSQMALLLDFDENPSRESLLADILNKGILNDCSPELKSLYECLEVKFQPLGLIKNVMAAVKAVKDHTEMSMYTVPLQRIVVLKVMQQLSKVYSTVRLEFVYKLVSGLGDISTNQVERILVEGVAAKQLHLKVNHLKGLVQFSASSTARTEGELQVSKFGAILSKVTNTISKQTAVEEETREKSINRRKFLETVLDNSDYEYSNTLDRQQQIEMRKQALELKQLDRINAERARKHLDDARRVADEQERIKEEQELRRQEDEKKKRDKLDVAKVQKELEKYNITQSTEALTEMSVSARRDLVMDAQNDAAKAKEDENRKLNEQAKRLDHITRALRMEGADAVGQKYAQQVEEDMALHAKRQAELQEGLQKQHAIDVLEKARLAGMQSFRDEFEADTLASQKAIFEKRLVQERKKAVQEKRAANIARARRLYSDELDKQMEEERKELERLAKIEKERLEQEQHEKLRVQRENEESAEKKREDMMDKMRKDIEEAEKLKASMMDGPSPMEATQMAAPKTNVYQPPKRGGDAPVASAAADLPNGPALGRGFGDREERGDRGGFGDRGGGGFGDRGDRGRDGGGFGDRGGDRGGGFGDRGGDRGGGFGDRGRDERRDAPAPREAREEESEGWSRASNAAPVAPKEEGGAPPGGAGVYKPRGGGDRDGGAPAGGAGVYKPRGGGLENAFGGRDGGDRGGGRDGGDRGGRDGGDRGGRDGGDRGGRDGGRDGGDRGGRDGDKADGESGWRKPTGGSSQRDAPRSNNRDAPPPANSRTRGGW